jgi:23S rRNA pseudouridine1911/1915/1917 synthase
MIDTPTLPPSLPVLWEDEYLVAIDKPPYISVSTSETEKNVTVAEVVANQLGIGLERAGIIHRLDKNTSGVLLIAKDQQTLEKMQALFKSREVHKTYTALVHGFFDEEGGSIEAPIARNPANREKFGVFSGGRESATEFHVEKRYTMTMDTLETLVDDMKKKERHFFEHEALHYSLVKVFPKTGRTHQIRVHMRYVRHPVVGDEVYTGKKLYRFDHRWCVRQFLHASEIEFVHPVTSAKISLSSNLPVDLINSLSYLS